MNIDKFIETIKVCRFCFMCRHLSGIGNVTFTEADTPRIRASLIYGATMYPEKLFAADLIDTMYRSDLSGACRRNCVNHYDEVGLTLAYRQDIAENGALVTEYTPDYPAYGYNFPLRNRIISGLSLGTVVVEAGETSGALITVDHALEQGRDIFVIPGDLSSKRYIGSNRLIRDGAKITTSPLDILEEYTHIYPHRINIEGCGEMLQGKGKYQPEVRESIYPDEPKPTKKATAKQPQKETKTVR